MAAAGVILVGGGMMLGSGKTIDLDHYLTVDIEGYDGYGTATATIDWNAIEKKYGSKIEFTDAARKEYGGILNLTTPMATLENSVYVMIDNQSGLSNDDTVTYSWVISDDVDKYLTCKVKGKTAARRYRNSKKLIHSMHSRISMSPSADVIRMAVHH